MHTSATTDAASRMRVVVIGPAEAAELFRPDRAGIDPGCEVLPQLPPPSTLPYHSALRPRLVRGNILCGEHDELYEKVGNRIRRLRRLVSGPTGEIIDVADLAAEEPRERAASRGEGRGDSAEVAPVFRLLTNDPGPSRVVRLSDFKLMVSPQLAHPERLRDEHRLPCYVQVYEVTAVQRLEALASAILGSANRTCELQPLTPSAVMQLQLAALLPPVRAVRLAQRDPGFALPYERFFHLQVASDPTAPEPGSS
jgi:hypothetical protein